MPEQIPPERKSEPLPATTTEEQQIVSAGQRNINLIWEHTQSRIALISVGTGMGTNLLVIGAMLFLKMDISVAKMAIVTAALSSVSLTVGIIIGFYFSRTNHSAIGGTGKKDQPSDFGTR